MYLDGLPMSVLPATLGRFVYYIGWLVCVDILLWCFFWYVFNRFGLLLMCAALFHSCPWLLAVRCLCPFGFDFYGTLVPYGFHGGSVPTPKVNLPSDSRFDPDPPDPNTLAAPRWSFAKIGAQTNAFTKLDILVKPLVTFSTFPIID